MLHPVSSQSSLICEQSSHERMIAKIILCTFPKVFAHSLFSGRSSSLYSRAALASTSRTPPLIPPSRRNQKCTHGFIRKSLASRGRKLLSFTSWRRNIEPRCPISSVEYLRELAAIKLSMSEGDTYKKDVCRAVFTKQISLHQSFCEGYYCVTTVRARSQAIIQSQPSSYPHRRPHRPSYRPHTPPPPHPNGRIPRGSRPPRNRRIPSARPRNSKKPHRPHIYHTHPPPVPRLPQMAPMAHHPLPKHHPTRR